MESLNLSVRKLFEYPDRTLSMLSVNGKDFCFILEDGYHKIKKPGETRIDGGKYPVVPRLIGDFYTKYKKQYKHKYSIEIANVPNFQDILMHIGNFIRDTRGCLLVGFGIEFDKGFVVLKRSTDAYLALYKIISPYFDAGAPVWIEITR